jgi:hypothetical protein
MGLSDLGVRHSITGLSPWMGAGKDRGGYLKTANICKRLHSAEARGMSFSPESASISEYFPLR